MTNTDLVIATCKTIIVTAIFVSVMIWASGCNPGENKARDMREWQVPSSVTSESLFGVTAVTMEHDDHRWIVFFAAPGVHAVHHPDCHCHE